MREVSYQGLWRRWSYPAVRRHRWNKSLARQPDLAKIGHCKSTRPFKIEQDYHSYISAAQEHVAHSDPVIVEDI